MSRRNWVNFFSRGQGFDLSNDLERGYESALLIQNFELEFYGDRLVRPDVELAVPRSVQARSLRAMLNKLGPRRRRVCRQVPEVPD